MRPILILIALAQAASAFAAGDAGTGKLLYAANCMACHAVDASIAGPSHRGVFGRKAGTVPGFDYSPALKSANIVWNEKTLDMWLANPEKTVPGQRMGVAVSDEKSRQDLIAYLKTLK
ncbi:c-type cytochrome [Noviherbaspirillum saxi]|uniref:Cytochrome c family protein n=1 Tax=Noviherbaspirillum saxi TaxID=2320863 RepID=A0A3A3FK90_9BURK|nr:c-type cytochrome [Noviherbaspirillum saxi]RJF95938.1 cytochrome c family protein [Noviherbaspirillum saxi]